MRTDAEDGDVILVPASGPDEHKVVKERIERQPGCPRTRFYGVELLHRERGFVQREQAAQILGEL